MNDSDKIRVLMIYYQHYGREEMRRRRKQVCDIMANLKQLQMIDDDMQLAQFSYMLTNRFGIHIMSTWDDVDIVGLMGIYMTDGVFNTLCPWRVAYTFP